jgi:glutathione S-transferase
MTSRPQSLSSGSHYAEGSVMPWFVMKLIFTIAPQRMPFLLRLVFGPIFGLLGRQIADPNIKLHADFVSPAFHVDYTLG